MKSKLGPFHALGLGAALAVPMLCAAQDSAAPAAPPQAESVPAAIPAAVPAAAPAPAAKTEDSSRLAAFLKKIAGDENVAAAGDAPRLRARLSRLEKKARSAAKNGDLSEDDAKTFNAELAKLEQQLPAVKPAPDAGLSAGPLPFEGGRPFPRGSPG